MFERNRVDNRTALSIAVELTFQDGTTLSGKAALPPTRGIHQLLDGNEPFLFIEVFGGESQFVPKATIRGVKLIPQVRPGVLNLVPPDAAIFDPFQILGVEKSATPEQIRAAYLAKAKLYHPDRYAGVALPDEVARYLEGMVRQIYAAFRAIKTGGKPSTPAAGQTGFHPAAATGERSGRMAEAG